MPHYGKLCISSNPSTAVLSPLAIPPPPAAYYNDVTMDLGALQMLQLLQIADSAMPVGAAAHSFGLETLVAEQHLTVANLGETLSVLLGKSGTIEALACRNAYRLGVGPDSAEWSQRWMVLNRRTRCAQAGA